MSVLFLIVLVVVGAAVGAMAVGGYNGLVRKRNVVDNSWTRLDLQLRKRHSLVQSLVQAARAHAVTDRAHAFDAVSAAADVAIETSGPAAKAEAEDALTVAVRCVLASAGRYPKLKRSRRFLEIELDLCDSANRIAYARQNFNLAVRDYNNAVRRMPNSLLAGVLRFGLYEMFNHAEPKTPCRSSPPAGEKLHS